MSSKSNIEVLIGGKVYTLSGYEGEEYLQKVAAYINNKVNEFNEMESIRRLPVDMKATLLQLNIADDYFKAKERVEKLEREAEGRDKEIYDLKHELISCQIQLESCEKVQHELESKNRELILNKARLEAALEDELLGKISVETKKEKGSLPQKKEEPAPVEKTSEESEEDDFLRELAALEAEEAAEKEAAEKEAREKEEREKAAIKNAALERAREVVSHGKGKSKGMH